MTRSSLNYHVLNKNGLYFHIFSNYHTQETLEEKPINHLAEIASIVIDNKGRVIKNRRGPIHKKAQKINEKRIILYEY